MWEQIGEFGDGQIPHETDWIVACYEFAIAWLKRVLGEPPKGCELGLMWHTYESVSGGVMSYPTLGLKMDGGTADWEYYHKCEAALPILQYAIEWGDIDPDAVEDQLSDD